MLGKEYHQRGTNVESGSSCSQKYSDVFKKISELVNSILVMQGSYFVVKKYMFFDGFMVTSYNYATKYINNFTTCWGCKL